MAAYAGDFATFKVQPALSTKTLTFTLTAASGYTDPARVKNLNLLRAILLDAREQYWDAVGDSLTTDENDVQYKALDDWEFGKEDQDLEIVLDQTCTALAADGDKHTALEVPVPYFGHDDPSD